jgi:hypothetical protein
MNGYDLDYDQEGMTIIRPPDFDTDGAEQILSESDEDNASHDPEARNDTVNATDGLDNDDIAKTDEDSDEAESEEERDNEIYTVNGEAFVYMHNPIRLEVGKSYRVYLVNMLEFDPVNSLHIHGAMFDYYPSGTSQTPGIQE